ncbi:lipoprotein [Streptomyces sp. NP-1717]|uniref:lipoprotein n=1 Tax=Streptomyces sp. NP-1717 TaxID=2704470 RepID=UPI0027E47C1B|nr:lipoprotein [Streptomyces sp. NP-1717]
MRKLIRRSVPAALLVALLTGCSSDSGPDPDPGSDRKGGEGADAAASPAEDTSKPAEKGGTIGAAGSPCVLPVTFTLAAKWTAEAVDIDAADAALAELARQGPVEMACEIDAKPAGSIGYLRVWTADTGGSTPREVLEAFVTADRTAGDAEYQDTKAGSLPAAEVGYVTTSELLDESKKERALAVTTPKGVALIHLGGLDSGEHDAMLPAFELAKKTLRAN